MERIHLVMGALLALTGVAAGAFGSHGLRHRITPELLDVFEIGVRYQMYHALALLVVGWWVNRAPSGSAQLAGWLLAGGTVIFSGTLYLLSLTGARWLGAITPIGGTALLAGWACLAWAFWRGPAA